MFDSMDADKKHNDRSARSTNNNLDFQAKAEYLEKLISAQEDIQMFVVCLDSEKDYVISFSEGQIAIKNRLQTKDVAGKKVSEVLGAELFTTLKPYYVRAFEGETVKYRGFLFNGRYYSTILSPLTFDLKGLVTEVVGNTQDITDEYYKEIENKKKTDILDSIIKNNPYSIQILNEEGRHVRHNSAFIHMFKSVPDENWSIFNDPLIQQSGISRLVDQVYNGEIIKTPPFWYNANWVDPKYPDIPICLGSVIFPVTSSNNKLEFVVVMHEDITMRVRAEEELIQAKNKAEEADRLKSAFLANMSHEIRTPMNGILGFAELLKNPKLTPDKQQKYVQIIEQSGIRLLNIINDLINISKLESGLMEVNLVEIVVNEQLRFLYDFFEIEATRKGLKLNLIMPELSTDLKIGTDKEKFLAIFTNLIKNSLKFTKEGGIDFGYSLENGDYTFFVKDSGIGIAESKQRIIFDRFVQAEPADNEVNEGAGLGLSISKGFVEMLGGKIWLESEKGKGTSFFFKLPQVLSELEYKVEKIPNKPSYHDNGKFNINVLVVDDDEVSLLFLVHLLEGCCKKVFMARDGNEAIKICLERHDVELVLMDIKMPELDGFNAAKAIREWRPNLPIIAQTAYATEVEKENYKAVFDQYVTKPVSVDVLKSTISRYLKQI